MALDKATMDAVLEAAKLIKQARYVTALTGAGVSVESGIRPFRGPGGLWTEFGEPPMDGYRRFEEDPKDYWKELISPRKVNRFGSSFTDAKPNPGHYALAELESMGILRFLVTQNIDNLHIEAGSKNVLEIHGNRDKLRCIDCESRFQRNELNLSELPPRCPKCSGIIKSDVVMFGEPIPSGVLRACFEEAKKSDCMIVAGTSVVVHPAAGLPVTVKRGGGKIIEVNPLESELSNLSDVVIRAASGVALPNLVEAVKQLG